MTTVRIEGPRHRAAPLVVAAGAFAVALAVLVLANRGGAAPRPGLSSLSFSVSAPGLSTDARIARLQRMVRAQPREIDALSTLAGAYLQKVMRLLNREGSDGVAEKILAHHGRVRLWLDSQFMFEQALAQAIARREPRLRIAN